MTGWLDKHRKRKKRINEERREEGQRKQRGQEGRKKGRKEKGFENKTGQMAERCGGTRL